MKQRYRLIDGAWKLVAANSKPHFRMRGGRMVLVRPGANDAALTEESARALIRTHWGQFKKFGEAFGFDCQTVLAALPQWATRRAGKSRQVRMLVGLPSIPSENACRAAWQRRPEVTK